MFQGANNVSTTGSKDAESVIAELKSSLAGIGMECSQKGYKLISKSNAVKFELEVVYIDELNVIGIRRKRVRGDSWTYKRIMDKVLAITAGVGATSPINNPPATPTTKAKTPLQTMV